MRHTQALLSGVARHQRASRARFEPPAYSVSQVTATYAEVWFPSPGCPWDELGHCTTCNYGAPSSVEPDTMVEAVKAGLDRLAKTTELVWVSAFDTLHPAEVPAGSPSRDIPPHRRQPSSHSPHGGASRERAG
jgi:uncharacterized Fe-S cluster-containing MiaB family protein